MADGSRATGLGSGTRSPRQRYSNEGSFAKPAKKKGGFTSFVNSMLGSPRKMLISGPENPVHVMHVGYDNETGQFTVCLVAAVRSSVFVQCLNSLIHHCHPLPIQSYCFFGISHLSQLIRMVLTLSELLMC